MSQYITSVKESTLKQNSESEPRPSIVGNIRGADCFHHPFASAESAHFASRRATESQEERIQGMVGMMIVGDSSPCDWRSFEIHLEHSKTLCGVPLVT